MPIGKQPAAKKEPESILEQAEKARNNPEKFQQLHTYYHGTLKAGEKCQLCP